MAADEQVPDNAMVFDDVAITVEKQTGKLAIAVAKFVKM